MMKYVNVRFKKCKNANAYTRLVSGFVRQSCLVVFTLVKRIHSLSKHHINKKVIFLCRTQMLIHFCSSLNKTHELYLLCSSPNLLLTYSSEMCFLYSQLNSQISYSTYISSVHYSPHLTFLYRINVVYCERIEISLTSSVALSHHKEHIILFYLPFHVSFIRQFFYTPDIIDIILPYRACDFSIVV